MLYGKFKNEKQAEKLKEKLKLEGKAVIVLTIPESRFPYFVLAWDIDEN